MYVCVCARKFIWIYVNRLFLPLSLSWPLAARRFHLIIYFDFIAKLLLLLYNIFDVVYSVLHLCACVCARVCLFILFISLFSDVKINLRMHFAFCIYMSRILMCIV